MDPSCKTSRELHLDTSSTVSSSISTTSLLCSDEAGDRNDSTISPREHLCGVSRPTAVDAADDDSCGIEAWGNVIRNSSSVLLCPPQDGEIPREQPAAAAGPTQLTAPSKRQLEREAVRQQRLLGHLIDSSLRELTATRNGMDDYFLEGAVRVVMASNSQFSVTKKSHGKVMMPPLCSDSCQTFATVSAVLLSSLGFVVNIQDCWNTSTVNYLLYISAWLHQLTQPLWGVNKSRPTVKDLNECLMLQNIFPAKVQGEDFFFLFYNEASRALDLIAELCDVSETQQRKRGRSTATHAVDENEGDHNVGIDGSPTPRRSSGSGRLDPVCGYVIVSGDYTVSVFAVMHDIPPGKNLPFSAAWNLCLCDSHGTLPWVNGKAAICSVSAGVPNIEYDILTSDDAGCRKQSAVFPLGEGVRHFCNMLFALLEHNRRSKWVKSASVKDLASPGKDAPTAAASSGSIPYMTWTPIRRRLSQVRVVSEITKTIDNVWIPQVLSHPLVAQEQQRFGGTHPQQCFWGSKTAPKNISVDEQSNGVQITLVKKNDVEVDIRRSAMTLSQESPAKKLSTSPAAVPPTAVQRNKAHSSDKAAPPSSPIVLKSVKPLSTPTKKPPPPPTPAATSDPKAAPAGTKAKSRSAKATGKNTPLPSTAAPTPVASSTLFEGRTGSFGDSSSLLNQKTLDELLMPANMVPKGKNQKGAGKKGS